MNIDELKKHIPTQEGDIFSSWNCMINEWKNGDSDIDNLEITMRRWLGNMWFTNDGQQKAFSNAMDEFIAFNIKSIGGMTMNERLFSFGLFERFDSEKDKSAIYKKVKAVQ